MHCRSRSRRSLAVLANKRSDQYGRGPARPTVLGAPERIASGAFGTAAEHLLDHRSRDHDAPAEPDGGDLASPDEVVGEPARDPEELAGALDRDRER